MEKYQRLERSLTDLIHEQQLKLGYRKETVRLYFPVSSLAHLLNCPPETETVLSGLKDFFRESRERLGEAKVTHKQDNICLIFPEQAAEYVQVHARKDPFLEAFISEISSPACSLSGLQALFRRFSDHVCLKRMINEEFDYLFYFEDGIPNDYRYCIAFEEEEHHATYHRFIPEDYEDYHFSEGESM